ncbi:MAG TPA: alpha/beta hydrolase-fold protein [Steroidobacteraceae bacterium]
MPTRVLRLPAIWILAACCVAALAGCAHTPGGRLQYFAMDSASEGQRLHYGIYEPPGWDHRQPLPLVVLLHGAGDDQTAADRPTLTERLDAAITAGRIPPFLMVTPEGQRGLWMDWHDGTHHFRSWVLKDLLPAVRATYPIDTSAGPHLVGVSMGGGGGLQMWLSDPGRFGSATILSAPIFNEEDVRTFLKPYMSPEIMDRAFGPPGSGHGADPYTTLTSRESLHGSRLVFGEAAHDLAAMAESSAAFHQRLTQAGVPHIYVRFPGFHRWTDWAPMIEFSLCHQLQAKCLMPDPPGWVVEQVE